MVLIMITSILVMSTEVYILYGIKIIKSIFFYLQNYIYPTVLIMKTGILVLFTKQYTYSGSKTLKRVLSLYYGII